MKVIFTKNIDLVRVQRHKQEVHLHLRQSIGEGLGFFLKEILWPCSARFAFRLKFSIQPGNRWEEFPIFRDLIQKIDEFITCKYHRPIDVLFAFFDYERVSICRTHTKPPPPFHKIYKTTWLTLDANLQISSSCAMQTWAYDQISAFHLFSTTFLVHSNHLLLFVCLFLFI